MNQPESPLVIQATGQDSGQQPGQDTALGPESSDALSQNMTGTIGTAQAPSVLPTLEAGASCTSEQLVQARDVSTFLGRPEPLVRDSLQESMLEVQSRRIAENKMFAGWASQSAKNATIAKEDIGNLKPVFDTLDMIRMRRDMDESARINGAITAYEPGFLESIKMLWNEGLFSVGEGALGSSLLGADFVERNAKDWGLDDLSASAASYGKSQRQRYQELLRRQPAPLQFDEGSMKAWGADFVRTVPQVGMQVSLAATTGPLSSAAFMGTQIAGNQYLDLTEHQGVDKSRAMWASLANAGMQMPLEYLGMDKLMAIGKMSGLGNVVRTAAVGALSEGATEWLQKYPEAATEIWALAEKQGRGFSDNVQKFMNDFGKITREGMYEGSLALPFGLLGGGGRIAATYRAERYATQQAHLQGQVEATKLRQMSPDMMQELLEQNGVTGSEFIQGQTALELFQSDPAYAEAFGLTQAQVMEAAAMGQDIEVSSARLMTKLDKERYAKVAEVMREAPGNMNLLEARSEEKLSEDTMRVLERWREQQEELSALAVERQRLRDEAIKAVNELPGLRTEAARMEGSVDAFVDTWLQPYERFAMRMASSGGRNMAENFRMLALNGLREARRKAMPVAKVIGEDIADMQPGSAVKSAGKMDIDANGRKRIKGAKTSLVGQKGGENARYEIWEAASLVPSHDPANGFARRGDYPEGVQERPYHSDAGEQEKVLRNAVELDPRYLVNNNPDAINGPPIVTDNGVVLGGNSRAMSLQVAYQNYQEQADSYRKAIAEQAAQYNINPEELAGYDAPVLVRVVDGELAAQDMAVKSRQYNQSQTQGLQTKAEGVSKARLISPETISTLAEGMGDFDSLRAFLDSAASKKFVEALKRDGVIEQTQVARLTDKNGKLNEEGKTLVENALRGMIVPDYDVLAEAPPSVLNKLDRSIPALARLKARGEGWDMSGVVTAALRQVNRAAAQGQNVDVYLGQGDLLALDADKNRPAVQAIALTFDKATQKEVQTRFELLAKDAERQNKGQASLVAMPENTPAASFVRSFMEPVALADGETIAAFNPKGNEQHAALQYAYDNGAIIPPSKRFNSRRGEVYFQNKEQGARGSVAVRPEGYLINLFKHADLSTLLHETGHIFLEEIERAIELGSADETLVRDYASLKNWLARFDNEAALKEEYNRSVKSTPAFEGRKFEELNDAEKAEARRIAEKEYFARGFEAYLMEGKAPSPELMGAFERFKAWLLNVYETAKRSLNVELNDDVRGVFDRLLATEEEIEQVAASNELFALTQKELDALGVKGPERNYQASLMEAAKRRAVEKLQLARDRDRRSHLAQWAKEARAEILQDPVYAARSELYAKDGHLDADAIAARYGEDSLKSLRKSVGAFGVKPGGQDPELFAAKHGFSDGAEMLAAITGAESMGKRVKEIVAAKEAAHDASIDPAPYLLETREAARQAELVGQYLARNLGKEALQQQAFERVAQEKLSAMPMGNARLTNQFTAAMRRALRQERIAIGKGDFEAALEANTQARLNMEFSKQARAIGEMQEATERAAKRFVKMAKADPSARYTVNDIAARYDLMQYDSRLIEGKDVTSIRNWIAARQEDGFALYTDDAILYGPGRSWREVSVQEFQNIAETISQIVAVERNSRKLMTAMNKESFEAAVDEAVQSTSTYREAKPLKTIEEESFITQGLAYVHAAHTKIEALCVALDGGNALGANWQLIYKPINDADNRRGMMFKELGDQLKSADLFGAYTAEELADMARKKTFESSIGESLTKGQRLMTALNMGNEGNYTRLLAGRNWTQEQAAAVVESLDARDWKFVQGIWDAFETYKEEAFSLQEEVSGQRPTSVEARPLKTQFGELRGGYFPVVYDRRHAKVDLQEKLVSSDNPAFAMTRHGHLQERNSQGAGTPLDLSMSVIPAKLQDVITDLCFRRAYIDVGRVLRDKKYRHSIESTVGHEQYQAMVAWLKDAAKESKSKSDGESIAQWARSSATAMAMGYKFTTMLSQPFGITQSIEALGYTYTMQGINMAYGKGIRATMETAKWVKEASPMMAQRINSFDRDVADATSDFARQNLTPDSLMSTLTSKVGLRKFEQWFKKNAFVPMGVVQYGVDLPTWCGAYQKGLKDFNGSETKARDYADSVVRLTQGSGATKDLARVQRGSQYAKLFTMFYSYFNTLYNMTALRVADVNMNRDMASVIRAGNSFLLLYMIPAILTEIASGRGPDDDEEFLAWSAKQLLMYPMQTVVGMRSIAGAIEGEFSYKASPAEAAPEAIYKFIVEVNKALTDDNYKFDGKKFAKLSLKTLGYMGGLPLGQAEISAFNVWDYLDGTSGDYELRDLIFRRQKSRR